MSMAYLKKKRAAEKVQREQDEKDRKAAEAVQLAAQRKRDQEEREAKQAAEAQRRAQEWADSKWERDLAEKVKARGGAFCTHGRHKGWHHPHGNKPEPQRAGGGLRRVHSTLAMMMVVALAGGSRG